MRSELSNKIIEDFNNSIEYVLDNKSKVSFAANKILTDLVSSGISVLDALDILYEARPHFKKGMTLSQIGNILNRLIKKKGYPSSALIRGKFNPLVIEYKEYEEILTYKQLKKIVENELIEFHYSSSTAKSIVEELYRVLKSIKTNKFREEQIRKIIPSVIRSVLAVDPFDLHTSLQKLYAEFVSYTKDFETQWSFQVDEERDENIVESFKIIAQIFLLTHHNLPGTSLKSTVSQVNQLISKLNVSVSDEFENREIYLMGKAARSALEIHEKKESSDTSNVNWYKVIPELRDLISRIIHKDVIEWIIINDEFDREIYSYYKDAKNKYQNLIGMALSGIQQLVNEVTSDKIKLIEQNDGYIYIERREKFNAFFFIKSNLSDYLKHQVFNFVNQVEKEQNQNIMNFNGKIKDLKIEIDLIARDNLRMMI